MGLRLTARQPGTIARPFSCVPHCPLSSRHAYTPNLRPATRDELPQSLSFALRFNGRKRVYDADELMAQIMAERLVEYLERAGMS
jgi:hypothetical protein